VGLGGPTDHRALQCTQRAGDVVYMPSGWWHAVLNTEHTLAVTENFAAAANLRHVLGELDRRVARVRGEVTAPAMCARHLRAAAARLAFNANTVRDGSSSSSSSKGGGGGDGGDGDVGGGGAHANHRLPINYSIATAEALATATENVQLLLFEGCEDGSSDRAASVGGDEWNRLERAAAAAASATRPDVLLVRVGCTAVTVREVFGVPENTASPTMRAAKLRGALFKFAPPSSAVDASLTFSAWWHDAVALEAWVRDVITGAVQPYLTAADRLSLMRMMRKSSSDL
jgi:hypothetical protein